MGVLTPEVCKLLKENAAFCEAVEAGFLTPFPKKGDPVTAELLLVTKVAESDTKVLEEVLGCADNNTISEAIDVILGTRLNARKNSSGFFDSWGK